MSIESKKFSNGQILYSSDMNDIEIKLDNLASQVSGDNGVQGPKGDKGDTGAQGIQGPKGDKGDTGLTGAQGIQGPKGDKGDTGLTGAQGIQGSQGIQGIKGDTGLTGPKGDKGDTGLTGPKGDKGDTGADGKSVTILGSFESTSNLPSKASVGDGYLINGDLYVYSSDSKWTDVGKIQGPKGDTGLTGPKGDTGAQGIQGPKGDKGDTGLTGAQGIQGIQGAQGKQGVKGDTGSDGPQGNQGPKGDKGDTGLTGPKGDTGAQGIQGPKGDKGDTGLTGPKGDKGDKGDTSYTAEYANHLSMLDIADKTDINTLKDSGSYSCVSNKAVNSPVESWFTLVVSKSGSFNGSQTLTDTNSGEVWTRTWNSGGTFTAWKKLATDGEVAHNTGDESLSGNKEFKGSVTFTGGISPVDLGNFHADGIKYAGTYKSYGNLKGLPIEPAYGVLEVIRNDSDIVQRFTQTNLEKPLSWERIKNDTLGSWSLWRVIGDVSYSINGKLLVPYQDNKISPISTDSIFGDATFKEILTNKSLYTPWEFIKFSAITNSNVGEMKVEYYKRYEKVGEQNFLYTQNVVDWMWQAPGDDIESYIAKITNTVKGNSTTTYYAINVSSNKNDLPIMGFLSKYGEDNKSNRMETLKYLNRLHINYIQYYDWFDRHSVPLPTVNGGTDDSIVSASYWTDFVRRPTRYMTLYDYMSIAKSMGMSNMSYETLNVSDTKEEVHGITNDMFLYNSSDGSNNKDDSNILNSNLTDWAKYVFYQTDWMNVNWQKYAVNMMTPVFKSLPFDGWHIDMMGNPGDKYRYNGTQIKSDELANGLHYFLNYAGKNLNVPLSINSVAEYGQKDISTSNYISYLYTEVWSNRRSYNDLYNMINEMMSYKDDSGNTNKLVIAGYMHRDWSNNNNNNTDLVFNDNAVILTDLLIVSAGASHLEMGEHMLTTEYFPNSKLSMSDNLKNTLPKINDIMVAYKRLFRIREDSDHHVWSNTHTLAVNSMEKGKISVIEREDSWYKVAALINLVDINDDDWVDSDKKRNKPTTQNNVRISVPNYDGVTYKHFYVVTLDNPVPREVQVDENNAFILESIDYYTLIYATKY